MAPAKHTLILGAGASLGAPAGLPLFDALRDALLAPLELGIDRDDLPPIAPEALLSRLARAGIDIDAELRGMLGGGHPNAVHCLAARVLARGGSIWTTNFDELIETVAGREGVPFHLILPGEEPECDCRRGHLVKVHGTLSLAPVLARAEDVLVPLGAAWLRRLKRDCGGATVTVLGYAGADIDLRSGLRAALEDATSAIWFSTPARRGELERRFPGPLDSGALELRLSTRPDLHALGAAELVDLTAEIDPDLIAAAEAPTRPAVPRAGYRPNDLSRAALFDAFGRIDSARSLFFKAAWRGPSRQRAARAFYRTGLIHGARWRPPLIAAFNLAAAVPLPWRWPHLERLPYLTWNLTPKRRLPCLERSLARLGEDLALLLAAANAAKETDPHRAVELGSRAREIALSCHRPADAAWASFVISLAYRSLGDLERAEQSAAGLSDGYGALAGPNWVAWGAYESAALAALRSELTEAATQMRLAFEVFAAQGSTFALDAACGQVAIARALGDRRGAEAMLVAARAAAANEGSLRAAFKREVLAFEEAELAREDGRLEEAGALYSELTQSPNLAQEMLGLLGLGEVQLRQGAEPEAAWRALRRSEATGFGYGRVHAALTLAFAGEIGEASAEELIASSALAAPVRDDAEGLRRYCQGPDPSLHVLCFPC